MTSQPIIRASYWHIAEVVVPGKASDVRLIVWYLVRFPGILIEDMADRSALPDSMELAEIGDCLLLDNVLTENGCGKNNNEKEHTL